MFKSKYWNPSLDVILGISSVISMCIAFEIIYHKHLRSNPAPTIAALCISESVFWGMGASRYLYCGPNGGANFEGFAAATIFFDTSEESQIKVMMLTAKTFTFLSFFSYNFSTIIGIVLQMDLVLTL